MTDHKQISRFEEDIRAAMAVPDPQKDLLSKTRNKVLAHWKTETRTSQILFPQTALQWGTAALVAGLIMIIIAGPRNVYAGFQRILGYIPGIGLVDQKDTIRILSEPISQERNGMNVTVYQAYLDENRTTIYYSLEGASVGEPLESGAADICHSFPSLRLPDGQILTTESSYGGGESGKSQIQVEYPPLPLDVDRANLLLPCLKGSDTGSGLDNWEFSLWFIPAGPTFTEHPVIERPTPTPKLETAITAIPEPTDSVNTKKESELIDASSISLTMDKLVQFDEGFFLFASLHWDKSQFEFIFPGKTRLLSAEGYEIPFALVSPDMHPAMGSSLPSTHLLAFQADTTNYSLPLTLEIDGVIATVALDQEVIFNIGENPYGGPWEINQNIIVSGHSLSILSVDAITLENHPGFEVILKTDGEVFSPIINDSLHSIYSVGGGPRGEDLSSAFILYKDGWPFGENILILESVKIPLEGNWKASWGSDR